MEGVDKPAASPTPSVFPDITIHQLVLAPDAPGEILIDRNDLEEPAAAIERVLAYHRGARATSAKPPGEEGAEMLRELLAPGRAHRGPDGGGVPRRGGAARSPLTHEQAMLLNRYGARQADGRHRLRRLGQDDARGRAAPSGSPRRATRCCSSASTARCATTCASEKSKSGVDFTPSTGSASSSRARPASSSRLRRRGAAGVLGRRAAATPWSRRSTSSAPQYDALIVDEAQDLHNRLARRADVHARATPRTRTSGCSWTTTSTSTTQSSTSPTSSARST